MGISRAVSLPHGPSSIVHRPSSVPTEKGGQRCASRPSIILISGSDCEELEELAGGPGVEEAGEPEHQDHQDEQYHYHEHNSCRAAAAIAGVDVHLTHKFFPPGASLSPEAPDDAQMGATA